ncbi:MAG: hypothetical protein QOG10_5564, partial [Kribbellaceae bacterium]|nr:hypothetical protein [Kribbellaceae bacterium]
MGELVDLVSAGSGCQRAAANGVRGADEAVGQAAKAPGISLDLCLHLVRKDHGSTVANQVARRCVVPPWRDGGQAQYVEQPVPEATTATTSATRAWALERLDQSLSLAALAAHARMSVRTFTRR